MTKAYVICSLIFISLLANTKVNAVTYVWKGGYNGSGANSTTNWHHPGNWTVNGATPTNTPTAVDDVIIPGNIDGTNQPMVYDWSSIEIRSLEIGTSIYKAALYMSCFKFKVNGNVIIRNNGTYENNGTPVIYGGNFTVETGGKYIESGYPENNGRGDGSLKYWAKSTFENTENRIQEIKVPPSSTEVGFNWLIVNSSLKILSNLNMLPADCYNKKGEAIIYIRQPTLEVKGILDPQEYKINFNFSTNQYAYQLEPPFTVRNKGTIYVRAENFMSNYSHLPSILEPNSTVDYLREGFQHVINLMYGNLNLAGSDIKMLSSGITGIANALTIDSNVFFDAITNKSTIEYNSIGIGTGIVSPQKILPLSYYTLRLSKAGTKTFELGTTTFIAGDLTIESLSPNPNTLNTVINFNGIGAQKVAAIDYDRLFITKQGIKTLDGSNNILNIINELKLKYISEALQNSDIILSTGLKIIKLSSATGTIEESEKAYVTGIVEKTSTLSQGVTTSFGNLGINITPDKGLANLKITRITGAAAEVGNRSNVQRLFLLEPPTGYTGDVRSKVQAAYFQHELKGPDESKLSLYWSDERTSNWWRPVDSGVDETNNSVTSTNNNLNPNRYFTIGSTITPFQVEVISFTAAKKGSDAVLNWAVASEENNSGFEVQASTDGKEYQKIGYVKSRVGTTSIRQEYSYTDNRSNKYGTVYYRLKQIDLDGASSMYGPRDVNFGEVTTTTLTAYPNPVEDELKVLITTQKGGTASLTLHDMMGKVWLEKQHEVGAGKTELITDIESKLPGGLYMLTIRLNEVVQIIKLVKR